MNILFDTNILLDVYLKRDPFYRDSAFLVAQIELEVLTGWVGSTTITTLHYLLAKATDTTVAHQTIKTTLSLFNISPVTRAVLEDALNTTFSDFEDAVLYESAKVVHVDGILTRNKKDFKSASIPIYTPKELIALL